MSEIEHSTETLLEMREIDKSFSGVQALRGVSLELRRAEVLALVGENGAGKSTLIKVLGGAHRPDRGHVLLEGRSVNLSSPTDAQRAGISIIYQEFNLIPDLTVRENIFLGREQTRWGFVRVADEHRRTCELFNKIALRIDPETRCRDLTVAQQQKVEIARALAFNATLIVMDEPTAALTSEETRHLLEIIRDLKAHGLSVIYISHRLEEIFDGADRVMVLRDGQCVGCRQIGDVSREQLIEMMVGRPIEAEFPKRQMTLGAERLRVENLCRGTAVSDVSFRVRAGEVLGIAGLAGAGRTETMRLVFGADRADRGRIFVNGRAVRIHNPRDAIAHGICLLTEDRKAQGLVLGHSVRENFGLPNLDHFAFGPFLDQRAERSALAGYVDNLDIRIADQDQRVAHLSGGNQQKVVLAKWLERNADIVIFDEPTRGIDVGAKYEIYLLINYLATQGKSLVMISSELPEILGMCDRILVMHEGQLKGEITDVSNATAEDILSLAIAP